MNIREKILVIEDEKSIARFISTILTANGYEAMRAASGAEAMSMISSHCPDLVILDLGLPDMDGLDILRQLRSWSTLPVVVVSARSHEQDKVSALDLGADDYLTKPFGTDELLARVRSQLRRYLQLGGGTVQPSTLVIGGIRLDDNAKAVTVDGENAALTPKEYDILRFLMKNAGTVFSPSEIYRRVWDDVPLNAAGAIAVHIRHLREKIEINPSEPRYIKVVWGKGYKMEGGIK